MTETFEPGDVIAVGPEGNLRYTVIQATNYGTSKTPNWHILGREVEPTGVRDLVGPPPRNPEEVDALETAWREERSAALQALIEAGDADGLVGDTARIEAGFVLPPIEADDHQALPPFRRQLLLRQTGGRASKRADLQEVRTRLAALLGP